MKSLVLWFTVVALLLTAACSKDEGAGGPNPTEATQNDSSIPAGTEKTPTPGGAEQLAQDSVGGSETQLAELAALVDLIVAEAAELPHAEFDPAALAAQVGKDPQKLQDWVRDHTYWAPYRGLLRGPKGVMLDRVGNSLDRAVLLGDLLRHSGFKVRLAHAQLSEEQARKLLERVRPIPAKRRKVAAPQEMSIERRRAITELVPNFDKIMEEQRTQAKRTASEAEALVQSQSEFLLAAVRSAASTGMDEELLAAVDAIRDHWWVERNDAGRWVAMDVLLPDSGSGETIAATAAVSEWHDDKAWPSIPDVQWQSVHMRVVVERYEAGDTKESTALELEIHPAELVDQPIALGHMPMPWRNGLSATTDLNAFKEAALAVKAWLPFLQVGDELLSQLAFTNEGDVEPGPSAFAAMSKVSGAEEAGSIAEGLGGFGGGEIGPAATAEWIDYEIRVPGSRPEKLRRPVFDLLGPARRANKYSDFDGSMDLPKLQRFEALFSNTSVLFQVSDLTEEYLASLLAADVVAAEAELRALSREQDTARAGERAAKMMTRLSRWGGPLPSLVLWRSTLAGESRDTFPDRPNVLNSRVTQIISRADEPVLRYLIDIASNSMGAQPRPDRDPFEVRVRQGVADTVAEMLAVGSNLQMAENTASVFARLASEGSRGLLIAAGDLDAVKALPWPEDEAARVAADVDAGFMTLVPRKAVLLDGEQRVGWWRVDPGSGETIGVMDSGLHGAATERSKLQQMVDDIAGFLARNPVQPLNSAPGSAGHAAWQVRNGPLCVLHQALWATLSYAAAYGLNVPPRLPLPLGCMPIG